MVCVVSVMGVVLVIVVVEWTIKRWEGGKRRNKEGSG